MWRADQPMTGNDHRADAANPEQLFDRACAFLRRGDPGANELLQQLQQYPDFAQGWLAVGRVLRECDQPEAALIALKQSLAAAQAPPAAAAEHADLLLETAGPVTSAAWLADACQRWPREVRLLYRLGHAQYLAGELTQADSALRKTVQLAPDFAEAWFDIGLIAEDRRQQAVAAEAFQAALTAQPTMAEAAFNLGICLQGTGAMEAALDAYARAFRLRPQYLNSIAQALTSAPAGRLWLDPAALRRALDCRA